MNILNTYKGFIGQSQMLTSALFMILRVVIIAIPTLSVAISDTRLSAGNFGATTAFAGVIQVEAEDLELSTYLIEDNEFASGEKLISLRDSGGTSGSASGTFRGEDGNYFIVVNYMDENDGISRLSFNLEGNRIESWSLKQDLGVSGPEREALTARTLKGFITLKRGDTYSIQGKKNNNEETRVDFIQFIPIEGTHQAEFASFFSFGAKVEGKKGQPKSKIPESLITNITPILFTEPLTFPEDILVVDPILDLGNLTGVKKDIPGFTRNGYVDANITGVINWEIETPQTADYSLNFRYSYGAVTPETRPLDVFVNKELVGSKLPFKSTSVDSRWLNQTVVARLQQGTNTISTAFPEKTGGKIAHIDYLSVTKVKYLNARGSVAPHHYSNRNDTSIPHPSAYHPEHGEEGYDESYYGHVDLEGERKTLAQWKSINGFNNNSGFETSAEYINGADLGFGREMHCLDNTSTSCYVDNYLNPGTNKEVFAATVTMERMFVNGKDIVAFFVYDKNGKRINQLGLDSEGAKSVPESCYACHGGLSHFGSIQKGGQYIPWDIALLKDWAGHKTLADQEEAFRELNHIAWRDAFNRKPEIKTLIESWYGGLPRAGNVFVLNDAFQAEANGDLIPKDVSKANWFSNPKGYLALDNTDADTETRNRYYRERSLYENVYTKYCRSCHVAQITDWTNAVDFNIVAYQQICNGRVSPIMPHAELTDDLFSNEQHSFIHGDTSTALEILCSQSPLKPDVPAERVEVGRELFRSKVDDNGKAGGCIRCHETNDLPRNNPPEIFATDLSCKVNVTNNLGNLNPAMKFSLSDDEVVSIKAYLVSLDSCN